MVPIVNYVAEYFGIGVLPHSFTRCGAHPGRENHNAHIEQKNESTFSNHPICVDGLGDPFHIATSGMSADENGVQRQWLSPSAPNMPRFAP